MPNFIPKKPKRDENGNIIYSSLKRKTPLRSKSPLRAKSPQKAKSTLTPKTKTEKSKKRQRTRSGLIKELDKVFSLYIRLRDSKPYGFKYFKCPTCGRVLPFEQADCSHYYGRTHMNTRYCEENCVAECSYCMTPDTLVLMKDLTWKELGELKVGDRIVSFEEKIPERRQRRSWKEGIVTHIHREIQDVYEVELENGDKLKTTADHQWLERRRCGLQLCWTKTKDLWVDGYNLNGNKVTGPKTINKYSMVCKPIKLIMPDKSWDAGWIAGMIDADGTICQQNIHNSDGTLRYGFRISICQSLKYPIICKRIVELLEKYMDNGKICRAVGRISKGSFNQNYDFFHYIVTGTNAEKVQFLMRVRPEKMRKFDINKLGFFKSQENPKVISITPLGKQEIVVMETDTHTFIANGYAMHNCNRFDSSHLIALGDYLKAKLGQKQYDLLRVRANTNKKWEPWELEQLIKFYKAKTEQLKGEGSRLNERF